MKKRAIVDLLYYAHLGIYALVWAAAIFYMVLQPYNPTLHIMIIAGMVFAPLLILHTYLRTPSNVEQMDRTTERQVYRDGFADGVEYARRLRERGDSDDRISTRSMLTDDGEIFDGREKQKNR